MTQYNKRYILSAFEKIDIYSLSNRRFHNKLSNDTKIVKIKKIFLKVQLLQSVYFLLFSLYRACQKQCPMKRRFFFKYENNKT